MNMFRAFMELDRLYESSITEAPMKKFASSLDSIILRNINSELPAALITSNDIPCGESAVKNALYLVSIGKEAKFCLGNIDAPAGTGKPLPYNTHCWVEHSSGILQTHLPRPNVELILKYSVDLVPNDVEASKKLIIDLVNGINSGTIKESIFDDKPVSMSSFVTASGKPVNIPSSRAYSNQPSQASTTHSNNKYVVRIVYDHGRLRALATDGVHPAAWVSFPNDLRQREGQRYEVDQLIWNGKNYRVAGNIKEI